MTENLLHVTDASFDNDVLQSDIPAFVDFWAAWCGPCKMIAPLLDEISEDYAGKLKVCKMDVDSNQELAVQYGVRSIPTLIIFKNGEVSSTQIGAISKQQLEEFIAAEI